MCVGNCKDPFVTYLKAFGYNPIRLPRANIRPLRILAQSGKDLDWMGELTEVFVTDQGTQPPTTDNDIKAANISGQRTGEMSIGLGLSLLGSVIGAMGGSKLGLDVAYKGAKSAVFEFTDVLSDSVSVARLDQFLGGADINPHSVTIGKLLEADQVYVVTSTVKSNKFIVEAKRSGGASLDVSVPIVQEIVGGNVKIGGEGATTSKLTYEGNIPLVFGFQAVRLYYDQGRYTAFKPLQPGTIAARALEHVQDDGADRLVTESTFAPLHLP